MANFDEKKVEKIVVFGGGTFGTAVGTLFARQGYSVCILDRRQHRIDSINLHHKNPDYLKEYTLEDNMTACCDAEEALKGASLIIHSIPVQGSEEYLERCKPFISPNVPFISLSKGIHLTKHCFMCDIIKEALGPNQLAGFLSGPSFARELMDKQPTGLIIASESVPLTEMIQRMLTSPVTRVYSTTDVIGVEVGGALKNIYAIAAGAASGMGYTMNTAALIVTRGCNEMKRLAVALGAQPETLAGLSGMGDLMLTCFGPGSRNRSVGVRLGKGEKIEDIIASMAEVAEGVPTAQAASELAIKLGLDLPMTQAVAAILRGEIQTHDAVASLMNLPIAPENLAPEIKK